MGASSLDEGWLCDIDGPTLPRLLGEILIADMFQVRLLAFLLLRKTHIAPQMCSLE